ncbi:MAG TPA: hypothetical protein VHW45_17455 [Candidatus Sulfotelmatobacter sp.]|jgi:hypothetical protein|nr:hypothetical protein [Candidatus Sulfotelmatobacter sp.]
MTGKRKKAKRLKAGVKPASVAWLHASVEDDLLSLAEEETGAQSSGNRPRKRRISVSSYAWMWK